MGSIRKWPLLINDDDDDDDNDNAVVNQEEYSITVQSQHSLRCNENSRYLLLVHLFLVHSRVFIFCNK